MTIAPLGLDIDSSAAVEAVQEIRLLIPAAKEAERAVETFATGVAQGLGRVRNSAEQIGAATLGVQQQIDSLFGGSGTNARDRAADIAAYGASLDALRAKFNPVFAAQQQYENQLEQIAQAERLGAISADEAAAARLREAAALRQAGAAIATSDTAFARLTGTFRDSRGQIQNTAFQLQDLIVQLQAGTSASTALSMQLPQLLGGFGAIGAVAGVLAAVGIPAVAIAMRALGDGASDVETNLEAVADAAKALDEVVGLQRMGITELGEAYAGTEGEILGMVRAMATVAQAEAQAAIADLLSGALREFTEEARAMGPAMEALFDGLAPGVHAVVEQLGFGVPLAKEFSDAVRAMNEAKGEEAQAAALARVRELLEANINTTGANERAVGDLLGKVLDVEQAVRAAVAQSENLNASSGGSAAGFQAAAGAAARLADEIARAAGNAMTLAAQGAGALAESQIRLKFKGDPVGEAAALAAERFKAQVGDFSGADPILRVELEKQRDAFVDNARAVAENQAALARWNEAQRAVAGSAGASGGGRKDATTEAEKEAEAIRRVVEGLRFEASMVGVTETARRIANETRRAGVDLYSVEGQMIADIVEEIEASTRATERLEEAQRYAADTASGLFTDAILGAESFQDAIGGVIDELGRMAITRGFETLLAGGGFGTGAFGNLLEGIFGIGAPRGAGRAGGGAVSRGVAHMVGERGPEWFVPDQAGNIVPNGGGGGVTVNQVLNIGAGADRTAVAQGFAALNSEIVALKQSFRDNAADFYRRPRYRGSV